jgi:hypothetical protein
VFSSALHPLRLLAAFRCPRFQHNNAIIGRTFDDIYRRLRRPNSSRDIEDVKSIWEPIVPGGGQVDLPSSVDGSQTEALPSPLANTEPGPPATPYTATSNDTRQRYALPTTIKLDTVEVTRSSQDCS